MPTCHRKTKRTTIIGQIKTRRQMRATGKNSLSNLQSQWLASESGQYKCHAGPSCSSDAAGIQRKATPFSLLRGFRGSTPGEGQESAGEDEDDNPLAADDTSDVRVQAKKARTEQLWALLNSRPDSDGAHSQGDDGKPVTLGPRNSVSLAALCKTVNPERVSQNTDAVGAWKLASAREADMP